MLCLDSRDSSKNCYNSQLSGSFWKFLWILMSTLFLICRLTWPANLLQSKKEHIRKFLSIISFRVFIIGFPLAQLLENFPFVCWRPCPQDQERTPVRGALVTWYQLLLCTSLQNVVSIVVYVRIE
ncbi:hypothetical protein BDZ45DRAFT_299923 [Acephala macrosclerotiorum]|nr:hypothetical protein BDZ45DRAFT_299923 [Acephala macrosclerotiorum]